MDEEMKRDKEDRRTEKAWLDANRELELTIRKLESAVQKRIAAGNEMAVLALRRLVWWIPECGFPKNVTPVYIDQGTKIKDYREEQGLNDPELRFCTETYTCELWGKEDARSFLAYLGQIARALGLEGLHDKRLQHGDGEKAMVVEQVKYLHVKPGDLVVLTHDRPIKTVPVAKHEDRHYIEIRSDDPDQENRTRRSR